MIRQLSIFLFLTVSFSSLYAQSLLHHEFLVELSPGTHTLKVIDTIHLSDEAVKKAKASGLQFVLHDGDEVVTQTSGLAVSKVKNRDKALNDYAVPVSLYEIKGDFKKPVFTLEYQRKIKHLQDEVMQGMAETPGLIAETGVYLASESAWYPRFSDEQVTFTLTVKLPVGWSSVSQGSRIYQEKAKNYQIDTWQEQFPQENIYLIAAQFHENMIKAGDINVYAFLRQKDDALAQRYLGVSADYLSMYEKLLGSYPYKKFALVENFWETGYGMPSFTLLGERVIRLPFILHTSYPHELVHNWWGNGVYVDYNQGNWSEGLTSYLADHLLKEQRGEGGNYRRDVLQKYTNFTQQGEDFSLDNFLYRQDQASEAVGYGKTMMLFHMLRKSLGDKKFIEGLQSFFKEYKFKKAGFADIEKIYSDLAHTDLHSFFSQWIERIGAPSLSIGETVVEKQDNDKYTLTMEILQTQPEASYDLFIPVAITLEGQSFAELKVVPIQERVNAVKLTYNARPLRIDVDPYFDVFRRLDAMESPPALSQVFGASKVVAIIPAGESEANKKAYASIASGLKSSRYPQIELISDDSISSIPDDGSVIILGEKNKFSPVFVSSANKYPVVIVKQGIDINGEQFAYGRETMVLVLRNLKHASQAIAFISLHEPAAAELLARKLPHYGKYGYLAFEGVTLNNIAKGQWPTVNSPLSKSINEDDVPHGLLPQFPSLINKN